MMATLLGIAGCRSPERESNSAAEVGLGEAPDPVVPANPIPMAPPRLWLFETETDTAEPAEFTGYGGKWSIDRRYPSPRYYQSLCHEPSQTSVSSPYEVEKGRQRKGDIAIADGAYFANVDLSAYVALSALTPGASAGLAFSVRAGDDLYLGRISADDQRAELLRIRPRATATIASGSFDLGAGQWHLLRVRAFGGEVELFIDDVSVARGSTEVIPTGMVGLWVSGSTAACFDEVAAAPR
ncbi:MAG: hypothetical protein DCC49_05550 [Acidobacteria bacterium]|nr:MAG: hypothetical protein DCC49_05550 [Acidobacteriota bacterium]